MPYVSKAQQGAMHAKADRGQIDPKVVAEFDAATKGQYAKLPDHVKAHKAKIVSRVKAIQARKAAGR